MAKDRTIILKYDGKAVQDGSIEVSDLVSGLDGLVRLASIIHSNVEGTKGTKPSLRIVGVKKGSFVTLLEWVESHPVLVGATAAIICTTIPAIAYYFREGKKHDPRSSAEIQKLIEDVLKKNEKGVTKALANLTTPLYQKGISSVSIGMSSRSVHEVANEDNYQIFHSNEDMPPIIHRSLTMVGNIRVLDKKTMAGKFVSEENDAIYSIALVMDNPENELHKFLWNRVCIRGVGTYDENKTIKRIEVEHIDELT